MDELLLADVNDIGFQGAAYQATTDTFPWRRFYPAVHVGPNGHLLRKMKFLNEYITRCQQFVSHKTIKADVLILFDPSDKWALPASSKKGAYLQETHFSKEWMGLARTLAAKVHSMGIPFRFVSPAHLAELVLSKTINR